MCTNPKKNILHLPFAAMGAVLCLFLVTACQMPFSSSSPPQPTNAAPPPATATTPTPQGHTSHVVVNANQDLPGVDTGVDVTSGEHLSIQAQGWASYGYQGGSCAGYPATNPDGQRKVNDTSCERSFGPQAVLGSAPIGALLATIAPSGSTPAASSHWFVVGSKYETTAQASGRLYLLYNDIPGGYGTNNGTYQVTITVTTA